jgi:hypothetical protein
MTASDMSITCIHFSVCYVFSFAGLLQKKLMEHKITVTRDSRHSIPVSEARGQKVTLGNGGSLGRHLSCHNYPAHTFIHSYQ